MTRRKNIYFYQYGFNITGPDKVVYEQGETVIFNLSYLASTFDIVTWNFYKSSNGSLIKTGSGNGYSTSFLRADGDAGIDVECIIDWGTYRTVFKKRHRLVIYPDCSTPDITINLSDGTLDPYITIVSSTQHKIDFSTIAAGKIVKIKGSITSDRVRIENVVDALTNPIIVVFSEATNFYHTGSLDTNLNLRPQAATASNGLWIYGKVDSNGDNFCVMHDAGFDTDALGSTVIVNTLNNCRFSGVKMIGSINSAGVKAKIDTVTRAIGSMDDFWAFDNVVIGPGDGTSDEGMYLGYSFYEYHLGYYHHRMKGLKQFCNEVTGMGKDGIQCGSSDFDCEVHDNYEKDNGKANAFGQNFGYVMNSGFKGSFFNNVGNNNIQCYAYSDTLIYNNFIDASVSSKDNALFVKRLENDGAGSPSYTVSDTAAKLRVFNNVFLSVKDSMYVLDSNAGATGKVPFASIYYVNNTCYNSGSVDDQGDLKYDETGGTPSLTRSNYISISLSDISLYSKTTLDGVFNYNSKLFFGANKGLDISAVVSTSELKLGRFTDITGQSIPLRGIWIQGCIHREKDYTEPLKTDTQKQWYQTNQSSSFSDADKIPDMYGDNDNTYALITASGKPKLCGSVRPVSKLPSITGTETFSSNSFT